MQMILPRRRRPLTFTLLALAWAVLLPAGNEPGALERRPEFPRAQTARVVDAGFTAVELNPLIGRWRRPDGGYILEFRKAHPEGTLEAYYFNPRPINVHRAEASRTTAGIQVRVELRDAGYPGSTYALLYKPAQDILAGYYFQAGHKQYFEVVFVRHSGP